MAEKERPDEGPSLEMPSLGSLFKRRKKSAPEPRPDEPSAEDFDRLVRGERTPPSDEDAPEGTESASSEEHPPVEPAATTPASDDSPGPVPEAGEPEVEEPEAGEPEIEEPEVEQTAVRGMRAVADEVEPEPEVERTAVRGMPAVNDAEPTEVLPEHDLIAEAEEADLADLEEDEVVEEPTTGASSAVGRRRGLRRRRAGATATDTPGAPAPPTDEGPESDATDGATETAPRRTLADLSLPPLAPPAAAAVTGVVVGLLAVALTYFGLRGCEAIKGTSSCGGPGIPILVAILVVLVVVGSVLLGAWKVTDPASTSFLAVGLLAVIALLFLIEVIFSAAMVVVIPLVSVGTYCLSQWVTTRFIEDVE